MYPSALFKVFGQGVHLYGIFIALGIVACLLVFFIYTKHKKIDSGVQDFVFYVAIIAIALGFLAAKLFQAVYNWIESGTFDFYNAGITAMGGFIGGAAVFLAVYFGFGEIYFKGKKKGIHKKHFNKVLLVAPICITIAHAFGRLGCLMAGCCHGEYLGKEYVVGGMWMRAADTGIWGYYVPTQLYEALFLFVLTGVLTWLYYKNFNLTHAVYLIGYGVWRIIIELFRTDARGSILGLPPSMWQSIIFILGGIALILLYYFKKWPFILKAEPSSEVEGDKAVKDEEIPIEEINGANENVAELKTESDDSLNKEETTKESSGENKESIE